MKIKICARCGASQFKNGYCSRCGLHKNGGKGVIKDSSRTTKLDKEFSFFKNRLSVIKNNVILDLSDKCA